MKQRRSKLAVLFVTLVLVLTGAGIAYAAWTDIINIKGEIKTGKVCWEFGSVRVFDDDPPENFGGDFETTKPDYTCHPGFTYDVVKGFFWELDKNVAWGEAERVDLDGDGLHERMNVTLHEIYPCNFNEFGFYVYNCGTIPIKIDHIIINGVDYYGGTPVIKFDFSGNGIDDFEISWNNNWGKQIEPKTSSPWEISFWTHVLQDEDPNAQDGTFTFDIEVVCIQFNEYTGGP